MHEKMTDVEFEALKRSIHARLASEPERRLLAHIAALTAERDDWKQAHDTRKANHETLGKLFREACDERDALRERVQALEAEIERLKHNTREAQQYASEAVEERNAAESHLAAIRQRMMGPGALLRLKDRLVDVWLRTPEAPVDAMMFAVAQEAARYVVGEDAVGAEQETEPSPAQQDWDGQHPHDAPEAPEPTTAEAFATVREGILDTESAAHPALAALSLLKRRMGAQEAAIRKAVKHFKDEYPEDAVHRALPALESALTDAPPVFTLEEVETAVHAVLGKGSRDGASIVSALRKVTP